MNTSNNKRKRESVERIEKVFIELLQSRELGEIRVSDICKRAELNRTTFYANYADIYSLADSIRDKLEKSVAELYREELDTGVNSNDYLKLFRHIQENQIFYRTYFKLGYDNNYKILAYDTALAREHFQNRFIEYHMEFFR
ncbi:MAG TPA: TetR/AcrR family transcriptional regulator, partial [Candidatus Gallacutalibacter pullistercoris]|nr:TetR/AcrR family transcriptional regulator [Candidatus Gallacutalibacter pullistercoris]